MDGKVEAKSVQEAYNKNKERLTEKERDIISKFYGLDNDVRHSLNEISFIYGGVTREWIRQLKKEALKKIRN